MANDEMPEVSYHFGMPPRIRPKAPVHAYIREWREYKGLTQQALGDRLGVDKGTVSRWENSRRAPDDGTLAAICEALGITLREIFTLPPAAAQPDPEPPPDPPDNDPKLAADLAEFLRQRRRS